MLGHLEGDTEESSGDLDHVYSAPQSEPYRGLDFLLSTDDISLDPSLPPVACPPLQSPAPESPIAVVPGLDGPVSPLSEGQSPSGLREALEIPLLDGDLVAKTLDEIIKEAPTGEASEAPFADDTLWEESFVELFPLFQS